jgi:hypothetical protein
MSLFMLPLSGWLCHSSKLTHTLPSWTVRTSCQEIALPSMTNKRSSRGLHPFFLVAGGSVTPSMTGMNMQFDNGWALVSCLFFLFGLVFYIDTNCVYGFMFFVLQFTNGSDEKKKLVWKCVFWNTEDVFCFFILQNAWAESCPLWASVAPPRWQMLLTKIVWEILRSSEPTHKMCMNQLQKCMKFCKIPDFLLLSLLGGLQGPLITPQEPCKVACNLIFLIFETPWLLISQRDGWTRREISKTLKIFLWCVLLENVHDFWLDVFDLTHSQSHKHCGLGGQSFSKNHCATQPVRQDAQAEGVDRHPTQALQMPAGASNNPPVTRTSSNFARGLQWCWSHPSIPPKKKIAFWDWGAMFHKDL